MAAKTFQGKPCRHGHDGLRYVKGGKCVECTAAYCATHREEIRGRNRAYREMQREEFATAKTFQGKSCHQGHGGLRYINGGGCVTCRRAQNLRRWADPTRREQIAARDQGYHKAHREQRAARRLVYNAVHREKITARKRQRRKNDPIFRLVCNLRTRINNALKGRPKSDRTVALLGCSPRYFIDTVLPPLLEAAGLTMEGMGTVWHLDHLTPLASFDLSDPEQQNVAFNFSNLRPLRAVENLSKGAKVPTEAEIMEHLARIW